MPFGTIDEGDQDGSFKLFVHDVVVDRQAFNEEFAEWLLEDPTPEAVTFVASQTNQTSDTVAAALTTSSWFLDYSADLRALNDVVSFGKHMMFWERPEEFNRALDRFLETILEREPVQES